MYGFSKTSLLSLLNLYLAGRSLAATQPHWPDLLSEELDHLAWDNGRMESDADDCRTRHDSTLAAQWVRTVCSVSPPRLAILSN